MQCLDPKVLFDDGATASDRPEAQCFVLTTCHPLAAALREAEANGELLPFEDRY